MACHRRGSGSNARAPHTSAALPLHQFLQTRPTAAGHGGVLCRGHKISQSSSRGCSLVGRCQSQYHQSHHFSKTLSFFLCIISYLKVEDRNYSTWWQNDATDAVILHCPQLPSPKYRCADQKKIHICDHNLNYHPPSLYQSFDEFRDLIRMLSCCSPL